MSTEELKRIIEESNANEHEDEEEREEEEEEYDTIMDQPGGGGGSGGVPREVASRQDGTTGGSGFSGSHILASARAGSFLEEAVRNRNKKTDRQTARDIIRFVQSQGLEGVNEEEWDCEDIVELEELKNEIMRLQQQLKYQRSSSFSCFCLLGPVSF